MKIAMPADEVDIVLNYIILNCKFIYKNFIYYIILYDSSIRDESNGELMGAELPLTVRRLELGLGLDLFDFYDIRNFNLNNLF